MKQGGNDMKKWRMISCVMITLCLGILLGNTNMITIEGASRKVLGERKLKLNMKGFCEAGPWEFSIDKDGHPYMLEWDTKSDDKMDNFWVELYRLTWKSGKKPTYDKINVCKDVAMQISSGDSIMGTTIDEAGFVYMSYYVTHEKSEDDTMFVVLNKEGNVVWEVNQTKKHVSILDVYRLNETMYVIMRKHGKTFLIEYDSTTYKKLKETQLDRVTYAWFEDGRMFGYIKKNNKSKKKLFMGDITGRVKWTCDIPKGAHNLYTSKEEKEDGTGYCKWDMWSNSHYYYYSNINGIYRADLRKKHARFKMYLRANASEYLKGTWAIVDMNILKSRLYLLMINGFDDEGPTHFVSLKLSKK